MKCSQNRRKPQSKHVEKYTGLFPEYRDLKPREGKKKVSNRMCKQKHTQKKKKKMKKQSAIRGKQKTH